MSYADFKRSININEDNRNIYILLLDYKKVMVLPKSQLLDDHVRAVNKALETVAVPEETATYLHKFIDEHIK